MADKKELERLITSIEAAIKDGHASDPAKKAQVIASLRQLKAGIRAEDHGPLDDLITALESSAVGLEASHPTLTAYLDRASRLLASIGI
ncbi:MAG: hypothetical protein SF051_09520 [Elusimicrobiota bacterium]|nr:hypothetical protein [Elusimicrobiota bacterium]